MDRSFASGIYAIKKCLIVPLKQNSDESTLKKTGKEVLNRLKESDINGVLIDVSAITILSSYGFSILKNMAGAISMMGANTVFVGFQPGVASSLVDLNLDFNNIVTALTTEDGLLLLENNSTDIDTEEKDIDEELDYEETDSDLKDSHNE